MPLPYLPAADSRHRRACFALYRALVRQGRQIPLPPDLRIPNPKLESTRNGLRRYNNDPVSVLVRNGFRRNRKTNSPRLVTLALKNGYKFLDLLSRASLDPQQPPPTPPPPPSTDQNGSPKLGLPSDKPANPITAQVHTFLRANQARVLAHLAKRDAVLASRPNYRPHPDHVPLLTLLPSPTQPTESESESGLSSNPIDPLPVYVPTNRPRPLSELSGGVRKVPSLYACGGFPFLRLGKPQSPVLEAIIRTNSRGREVLVRRLKDIQDYSRGMGRLEDEWEGLVERVESMDWGNVAKRRQGECDGVQGEKGREEEVGNNKNGEIDWDDVFRELAAARNRVWKRRKSMRYRPKADQDLEDEQNRWFFEKPKPTDWASKDEITHEGSWEASLDDIAARLTQQHQHWVARGRALWQIVAEERKLAEQEAKERGMKLEKKISPWQRDRVKAWEKHWTKRQMKQRTEEMYKAEERGDHETARRIAKEEFVLRRPGWLAVNRLKKPKEQKTKGEKTKVKTVV